MENILLGLLLSSVISILAYYKKSLNKSGLISAIIIGTLIYTFGTYIIFTLLMFFFITSSMITKDKSSKIEGRNYIQVLANGFTPMFFSILYYIFKDNIYLVLAATSIAATTSDTWASELGKYSKGSTRSILSFKEIPKGESGGVSLLGTISSIMGSLLIGLLFVVLVESSSITILNLSSYGGLIVVTGFLGNVIDSYLGIIVQEKYFDENLNKIIELNFDRNIMKRTSGIKYINNDVVNILSSLSITLILWSILILI